MGWRLFYFHVTIYYNLKFYSAFYTNLSSSFQYTIAQAQVIFLLVSKNFFCFYPFLNPPCIFRKFWIRREK